MTMKRIPLGGGRGGGFSNGSNSSSNNEISAWEILDLSNSGDMERVVAQLAGGSGSGNGTDGPITQKVTFNKNNIGLPDDGTLTLVITGDGVDVDKTGTADADGNVSFEIPGILTGTEITVTLTVKSSDGTILYWGTNTQTLVGSEFTVDVKLGLASFSGTTAEFVSAVFASGNTVDTPYTVRITSATNADLASIASAIASKGVYVKLDLSDTSIDYIGDDTFNASSNAGLATYLTGIELPSGLTCLGHRAFKGCTALSGSVTIPSLCTVIGQDPFLDTGVTSLSDAMPGRTWSRKWEMGGLVPTPNAWSGTLADSDALSRIDANRPDIGSYNYSTP